jgi:hypothetical protein
METAENHTWYNKTDHMVKDVYVSGRDKIVNFLKNIYHHAEAITVMILASLGLNSLLGEVPFYFTLPMWVEPQMVIPVASVIGIGLLVGLSSWRAKRRPAHVEAI